MLDSAAFIALLNKYTPNLTISEALEMFNAVNKMAEQSRTVPLSVQARQWADGYFTQHDLNTRKIGIIKEIRTKFGMGLKEAKDVADSMTPYGLIDFFETDDYGFQETKQY